MKAVILLTLALGAVWSLAGCTSSSRRVAPPKHYSEYSTAWRLWQADDAIEHRAKSLERSGLSAKEARQYAEAEYLKSRAGSPLR